MSSTQSAKIDDKKQGATSVRCDKTDLSPIPYPLSPIPYSLFPPASRHYAALRCRLLLVSGLMPLPCPFRAKIPPPASSLQPPAYSLQPTAYSLKPQASSLKPQASSLKSQVSLDGLLIRPTNPIMESSRDKAS